MEKIFITVVILYALFVGIYLLYLKAGRRRKKDIVGKGSSIHETGEIKTDIIGKSRFDLSASKPLLSKSKPLAATPSKSENSPENTDTFVPSNEIKRSAEVPEDELDEAFSDTLPSEDDEPIDIDYPLDYETSEENEDESEDEEEEEVIEGMVQAAFASGVRFEDLRNVVRTVNKKGEATPEERQKAGDTLLEMRRTDMFEQVVSEKPDAKRIVSGLMAESLANFYLRKDKETETSGNDKKVPDNFNVRDFV